MNRITNAFEKPKCRCRLIRRRLRKLAAECNAIETIASCVEFIVPGAESYARGKREVGMFVNLKADKAKCGDDLKLFAAQQLRAMSRELAGAAERLEGSVSL
jgi:hypothetical protein